MRVYADVSRSARRAGSTRCRFQGRAGQVAATDESYAEVFASNRQHLMKRSIPRGASFSTSITRASAARAAVFFVLAWVLPVEQRGQRIRLLMFR